jgi:hypothetical protein
MAAYLNPLGSLVKSFIGGDSPLSALHYALGELVHPAEFKNPWALHKGAKKVRLEQG